MKLESFLFQSPLFSLHVAHEYVLRRFAQKLAAEGVHLIQALVITGLFFEEKPVRPSRLAATLQSSRSNISHAVRGLERQGFLERVTPSDDARAYDLALTKQGRRKAAHLIQLFDEEQATLEAAGGAALCERLREFLDCYRV